MVRGISIKIRKDNTGVIGEYEDRKREDEKMRLLEEQASRARAYREREERIRQLKSSASADTRAARRAKYAGLYSFGSTLRKGAKNTGRVVGRGLAKGIKENRRRGRTGDNFSSFNQFMGVGTTAPRRKKRSKSNKAKRIVIYG